MQPLSSVAGRCAGRGCALIRQLSNSAYHITEMLIFYADKLMVMGNSKNLRVFNFAILVIS